MSKITLTDLVNLQNETTAVSAINDNMAIIQTAMDNTLSRDGTSPNQMEKNLDMNSNRVLNLPAPLTNDEPLRLADANTLNGGGTIQSIPAGGITGQALVKLSNADYDVNYENIVNSVGLALPSDFTVTNSPVTLSGNLTGSWAIAPTGTGAIVRSSSPTLVSPALGTPISGTLTNCTGMPVTGVTGMASGVNTFLVTPTSANLAASIIDETGTGSLVFANSPSLTTPVIGSSGATLSGTSGNTILKASATASGTLTIPAATDTLIGKATTDTLTNKTFDTSGTGNSFLINSVAVSRGQYPAVNTNTAATSGNIGEVITASVNYNPGTSVTSATPLNITSISVPAGEWLITGMIYIFPASSTNVALWQSSISSTSGVNDTSPGRFSQWLNMGVPGNNILSQAMPCTKYSLSTTTTIYLVTQVNFSVSTLTAGGSLTAWRFH